MTPRCFPWLALAALTWLGPLVHGSAPSTTTITQPPGEVPWKIRQTVRANYPLQLKENGVMRGEARVRLSVTADGQLFDALLIAATHLEFGAEAVRVARLWRYEPAVEDGEPIGVVADVSFVFEVNGMTAATRIWPAEKARPGDGEFAYRPEVVENLDQTPTAIHVVAPTFPQAWAAQGIRGSATLEFFIDEQGRARVPVVTRADHPLLGASAVAALVQWRFERPTRHGRPVLVRAEQVFNFPGAR